MAKTLKRRSRRSRKSRTSQKMRKSRTFKKKQVGGSPALLAVGGAAVGIGLATAAYLGLDMLSKINDTSTIKSLINSDNITFLPKYQVVETPQYMKQYLESVDTITLFKKFIENPDLMRSKSLYTILKTASEMGKEFENINRTLRKLETSFKLSSREKSQLQISKTSIKFSKNHHIKKLENYLLATAKEPGRNDKFTRTTTTDKNGNINVTEDPYLSNRSVDWYQVIITGVYDERAFNDAVDTILKKRGSYTMIHKKETRQHLQLVKNNKVFRSAIFEKMAECVSKPRGVLDYISNTLKWDSSEKCLRCPQEDCLIYIYKFYYKFLLDKTNNLSIPQKIRLLILCEARMCALSKCIMLEAVRIQDNDTSTVDQILSDIFNSDLESGYVFATPNEKFLQLNDLSMAYDPKEVDVDMEEFTKENELLETSEIDESDSDDSSKPDRIMFIDADEPSGETSASIDESSTNSSDNLFKESDTQDLHSQSESLGPSSTDPFDPSSTDPLSTDPLSTDPLSTDPFNPSSTGQPSTDPLSSVPLSGDSLSSSMSSTTDSLGADNSDSDTNDLSKPDINLQNQLNITNVNQHETLAPSSESSQISTPGSDNIDSLGTFKSGPGDSVNPVSPLTNESSIANSFNPTETSSNSFTPTKSLDSNNSYNTALSNKDSGLDMGIGNTSYNTPEVQTSDPSNQSSTLIRRRRRKTLKKMKGGGEMFTPEDNTPIFDKGVDPPAVTDTEQPKTESSEIKDLEIKLTESELKDAAIAEDISNTARGQQIGEEAKLDKDKAEVELLDKKIESKTEEESKLNTEIQGLEDKDKKLEATVAQEENQSKSLESQLDDERSKIDELKQDYEVEQTRIEDDKVQKEEEIKTQTEENKRQDRMKMIIRSNGLDLQKIYEGREKLSKFYENQKKKDTEYPSDIRKVNNPEVQTLLEDIWTKEVIDGFTLLELLEGVLTDIDSIDIETLKKYLKLLKLNLEFDILRITGELLNSIFGYDEEIMGDVTEIGLSTMIEREFKLDTEDKNKRILVLEFLATLLLNPDVLHIEYMGHFEDRRIRNQYTTLVMRHLLDGIDNIDPKQNIDRFLTFWESCDQETQMSLQDIAHKKLLVLGKADMLKMNQVKKVGKFSNKTNPICKEMLQILKNELENNEEIVIDKSRLAELSNCDN